MLVMPRRPRSIVFLVVFTFSVVFFHYKWAPSDSSYAPAPIPNNPSKGTPSPWCQGNECAQGQWIPRRPFLNSYEEFRTAHANAHDVVWRPCKPIPPPLGVERTEEEVNKAGEQRVVDVANWEWMPNSGKMKKWDAEEFVVRLLRRPGGMIFIGDSLTGHHFYSLGYLLQQADITFDDLRPPPRFDNNDVKQLILRPGTPMTQRLLERAGVPASRLDRPFLTRLSDHLFVNYTELREITEGLGAPKDFPWTHNYTKVDGWTDLVRDVARPRDGEEDSVTEDTVMLMNTGAHWSRGTLGMLPRGPTYDDERERVREAYRQMIKRVSAELSPIPQLSIYYRSTTPAHPDCDHHTSPYASATQALVAERNVGARLMANSNDTEGQNIRARWDWGRFNVLNDIWRNAMGRFMRERAERVLNGENGGAKWFFVDLWEQALQRPDAHTEPGNGDCLHWCPPGIINQWTYHMNHLLFLEDKQSDV